MIMHKKWSSMPAIQLNIYIFCKDVWDIMLGGSFSTYCRGWVELPVATRELQTHLCQKHSMYCCWRVERPPITFGNNFWSWAKTYCGWLQKPAPVDWWQRSHFGVGFNHPSGAGFLLPSTVSKSIFGVLHEISIKWFRNHPQNHIITIYFWCYPEQKYPSNISIHREDP